MSDQYSLNPNLLLPAGTKVVVKVDALGTNGRTMHPAGALAVIVQSPVDHQHAYRVRFHDGIEASFKRIELAILSRWQREAAGGVRGDASVIAELGLEQFIILRSVVGSRAYGLSTPDSDTDRRGVYLPPAEMHWSLYGVPDQLENDETQEVYWELQKFLGLALKCNPTVLETLFSPRIEHASPVGMELVAMRNTFLSRLAFQTYSGYVASQFKKIEADFRQSGDVKWKHAMHLIRLLLLGAELMRTGTITLEVGEYRDKLMRIRAGEMPWAEVEAWRQSLHRQFEELFVTTPLPERPDYEAVNAFLIRARRSAVGI